MKNKINNEMHISKYNIFSCSEKYNKTILYYSGFVKIKFILLAFVQIQIIIIIIIYALYTFICFIFKEIKVKI